MSKPLVTFPDPEAAVINALKAAFLPRVEAYKPATVTTAVPVGVDGRPVTLTTTTHLQVELEVGNADDYPIAERAQVRVTCYAAPGKRTDVKRLASLAQGLTYTISTADVAGVDILIGRSDVITDPDTKNLMVWFLARVNLKATLLAS
jgi:hypothetical protein